MDIPRYDVDRCPLKGRSVFAAAVALPPDVEQAAMHGVRNARFRSAIPPLLVLVWVLAVHGHAAAASDGSPGSAPPAAGAVPYLSLGMGVIRSEGSRFVDGEDAGHAALYGSAERFDAGAFRDGLQVQVAAGVRLPHGLRAQLELGVARALNWRGNTNYRAAGGRQPSEARLDARQLLLAGFHDLPGWKLAQGRRARPFLGAGLGVTEYRLNGYVQRFPEPDDPRGSLRRGPGGEVPFTALPGGSGRSFTWMLTAGVAMAIGGSVHLDLSYRYTDAGEIRTDPGDIAVVRYREDGTGRKIRVPIDETSADHRTHSLLVTLRFEL